MPHLGHQSALAGTVLPHSGQTMLSVETSSDPSAWTTTFSWTSSNFAPHLGHSVASDGTSAPHSEHWKKSFFFTLSSSGTSMYAPHFLQLTSPGRTMAPHCLHLPYPWGYSLPSASILARVFSALLCSS